MTTQIDSVLDDFDEASRQIDVLTQQRQRSAVEFVELLRPTLEIPTITQRDSRSVPVSLSNGTSGYIVPSRASVYRRSDINPFQGDEILELWLDDRKVNLVDPHHLDEAAATMIALIDEERQGQFACEDTCETATLLLVQAYAQVRRDR